MRMSDIKVNAEYVYAEPEQWNRRDEREPKQVRVLTKQVRRYPGGPMDGVEVEFLNGAGQGRSDAVQSRDIRGVVQSRDIRERWETFKPAHDAAVAARAAKNDARREDVYEVRRQFAESLPEGYDFPAGAVPTPSEDIDWTARLRYRDVAALVAAAYEHGRSTAGES